MKRTKLLAVLLVVVLMLSMSSAAFADYPEKAIEVLIPAGPGGDTDTTVRAISASLTELLGQPVVVTNMPGGAGTVAMTELLNRDADGYSVFYHHVDTLLLELLKRMDDNWKWEDALDISAVTGGGNTYCLFVRKDNDKGIKTFEDLINYAKENPYELTYAVEMGGTLHMHALALMQAMDIEVDCIDLGAASDRTIAFLGGQCDILEGLYSQGKEYIESGEFVPLCVLGNERNENFPDIPCSGELGFDFGAEWFYYFGFKKGTDPAIIETFTNAVKEAVEMEPYSNALDLYNFHANFQPGEDGVKFMQGVEEVYAPMAEALLAE
ncbi:MAG: tripartite tricarboxylate transporter substrate binding protein [Oscillospiraceae bacterium]|nr:tripartite tricarboxylate transporter substrate binding protein [Oscillospiraceae bacterium]